MNVVILRRAGHSKESCEAIASQSKTGIVVKKISKDQPLKKFNTILRWGCLIPVVAEKVFNNSDALNLTTNKTLFRSLLMKKDPDIIPKTWFFSEGVLEDIEDENGYPVIVRPQYHHSGKHVYLCNNISEITEAIKKCGPNYYISEYIPKEREFRIMFVQGRVAWVCEKHIEDKTAIAWNHVLGSSFKNVKWKEWPFDSIRIGSRAFELSQLDFGAVDIMVDKEGRPFVLEINSSPLISGNYRIECMARCFDYMVEEKEKYPIGSKNCYVDYIHPVLEGKNNEESIHSSE